MDVNGFLAGLPAVLGIVGFIVYQILQHFGKPNAIVSAIVQKLRLAAPERAPDQRLTASGVDRLLRRDDGLRRLVSEQDFALLKKVQISSLQLPWWSTSPLRRALRIWCTAICETTKCNQGHRHHRGRARW